jgi:hypothetical protein
MKMKELRQKAKELEVKAGRMKKVDLVRTIQTAEGNQPCFGKSGGECSEMNCCFRDDCMKISG